MIRPEVVALPGSCIREVANAAMERTDVLPFWFGESDQTTPPFVRDALEASLRSGETFYSPNLGLSELREALASYMTEMHRTVAAERIVVTSSGVSGLMLSAQALMSPGDKVVAITPVWPNIVAQPEILGAVVERWPLEWRDGDWHLDMRELHVRVTSQTKVLLVNAPANPTGWTLSREEQLQLLRHCRSTGTWIVADEVYSRIWFGEGRAAPSFLDIAAPQDKLIVVHSFSKSFLMTGWRLGWLVVPEGVSAQFAKLIEFNTSCSPVFVQRSGLAALSGATAFVPELVAHFKACRDRLVPRLKGLPGVQLAVPRAGLYAFFKVANEANSLALCQRLVREQGLGLAPGIAFGPEAEGWVRWCFASKDPSRLDDGLDRLKRGLRI
jgi:aspartate/methionine/tyrosine aminotransferase